MYIGPWQEYRLAKIQDDAIQRLRKEWEDQLREQIPEGDEARIRELMQPMMAKLPALLLASKSKSSSCSTRREKPESGAASRASSAASLARPPSSQSVASTSSTSRRVRDEAGASGKTVAAAQANNQETHDDTAAAVTQPVRPPGAKKKKKAKPQLSALDEVQRRKKMFSKWIKTAAIASDPGSAGEAAVSPVDTANTSSSASVVLPRIHQRAAAAHGPEATDVAHHSAVRDDDDFRLPPIRQPVASASAATNEWEFLRPYEPTPGAAVRDGAQQQPPDFEDSLDEDEVNNLLNWTDTFLSPTALDDGFPDLGDDDFDVR